MFKRRISLFRAFGFEVSLDASWFILFALITWVLSQAFFPPRYPGLPASSYWAMGIAGAILLFASVVAHEFAHALVAMRYGLRARGITLFIFGGMAEMDREPPSARVELLMTLAGPAASAAAGCAFYLAHLTWSGIGPPEVRGVLAYLYWINWLLALFNLIPAFPLDGGRALRAILWRRWGDLERATRTACLAGSGFGWAVMVFGGIEFLAGARLGAIWWFAIGMYLRSLARGAGRRAAVRMALKGEPVRRFMSAPATAARLGDSIEEFMRGNHGGNGYSAFPVVNGANRLAGWIAVDRIEKVPRTEWLSHTVEEFLEPCSPDDTIGPEADSAEALSTMTASGRSRLLVIENGQLLATVSYTDLARAAVSSEAGGVDSSG